MVGRANRTCARCSVIATNSAAKDTAMPNSAPPARPARPPNALCDTLYAAMAIGLNWWMCPAPRVCVWPIATWKLPATLLTIMCPARRQPSPGSDFCAFARCSRAHCSLDVVIELTSHPRSAYAARTSSHELQHCPSRTCAP